MTARDFYDWQTAGGGGDVLLLVETLERAAIPWCMIGGLAVNHWALEPMATANVDLVIATDRIDEAVSALEQAGFQSRRFDWSINLTGSSKVTVQISTDKPYRDFPSRGIPAEIHGILMRVASLEDTLTGKLLAYQDSSRRASKRQKDLADISRLLEAHPEIRPSIPQSVLDRLEQ